jgi:hypothetical protein
LLDRAGARATAYPAPDPSAHITGLAVATNHQERVEWAPYAAAIRSVARFHEGCGTLYTAEYRSQRTCPVSLMTGRSPVPPHPAGFLVQVYLCRRVRLLGAHHRAGRSLERRVLVAAERPVKFIVRVGSQSAPVLSRPDSHGISRLRSARFALFCPFSTF